MPGESVMGTQESGCTRRRASVVYEIVYNGNISELFPGGQLLNYCTKQRRESPGEFLEAETLLKTAARRSP